MSIWTKIFGSSQKPPAKAEAITTIFESAYSDSKWGFSIQHPKEWSVVRGEHCEGEWTKPVVLVRNEGDKRVACLIVSVGALHQDGTIAQYMQKAQSDLARGFDSFTLSSAKECNVNGLPTAWMHYHYSEQGTEREEFNVTFFPGRNVNLQFLGRDAGVPFQIVCFTDRDRFTKLKDEFSSIIQSLSFPNGRLFLCSVALYGTSQAKCMSCGKSMDAKDSCLFVKFPENEFAVSCAACSKV